METLHQTVARINSVLSDYVLTVLPDAAALIALSGAVAAAAYRRN